MESENLTYSEGKQSRNGFLFRVVRLGKEAEGKYRPSIEDREWRGAPPSQEREGPPCAKFQKV